MYNRKIRGPLIEGNKTVRQITKEVVAPLETTPGMWWYIAFGISSIAAAYGVYAMYITVSRGIGTWGLNNSVAWGWDIINFIWWIGIGHAGTAFSIFLLVLRQRWRTSINRSAEAMTVLAVACAALFPLIHMGRIWLAFYIIPYPNTRGPLWVNFNSPLFWDFTAITAYLLISVSFWYLGMLPDFGTIRDKTSSKIRKAVYGFFSLGWTGSSRQWIRFESLSFVFGGLAAVLVVSVHSIVATDFAAGIVPGWHSTVFPPFFVYRRRRNPGKRDRENAEFSSGPGPAYRRGPWRPGSRRDFHCRPGIHRRRGNLHPPDFAFPPCPLPEGKRSGARSLSRDRARLHVSPRPGIGAGPPGRRRVGGVFRANALNFASGTPETDPSQRLELGMIIFFNTISTATGFYKIYLNCLSD